MIKNSVTQEQIVSSLEGINPQKYIIAVEASYYSNSVHLVINDPVKGKYIQEDKFKPFVWLTADISKILYGGDKQKLQTALERSKVKLKPLITNNSEGYSPERLKNGYRFIATCDGSYNDLLSFFKFGGVDVYGKDYKKMFVAFSPTEQYLIQTGKRLFKGFDDYSDLLRFQFDLETKGLDAKIGEIFQIGIKDNRGFEVILETQGVTPQERRDSERVNIIKFFEILDEIKPDVISGYNSEFFDWSYFDIRCSVLGIPMEGIAKTLNPNKKLYRRESKIKLGSESETYMQTHIWGTNVLDVSHAVRRAQAINSDIKFWNLKYITKFSKIAKPNRVYVQGDKIHTIWADTRDYWFLDSDGTYGLLTDGVTPPESHIIVKGDYIVKRYLLDDLWETEQVDGIYNQASFLIGKLIPTSFQKSSTMGTASQWKLIMAAWSYEHNLAIPMVEAKRDFTGGLARLLVVGYAKNVVKFDYAALYPKTELTDDIFPDLDISGVMKGLLTYIVDTRDQFKDLTTVHKKRVNELKDGLAEKGYTLNKDTLAKVNRAILKHEKLKSDYDKKQLPLKILANSWFGAYGAPHIFPWGDTDCAEETTCRGRQSLRLMVRFFVGYGFIPLVGDTDGFNFSVPDNVDTIKYVCKGSHWKTKFIEPGTVLYGVDAALAEFNETLMLGRMGLDIDDMCDSTINFKRKNYGNLISGDVKLVGNTLKSKAMPVYIENFIDKAVRLLLENKGYEFVQWYYDYVDMIFEYKIPVAKMASKSRVKMTKEHYLGVYIKSKTKKGAFKARQAHMELAIANDLDINLGDTIYYINTGTSKSHSDVKKTTDKVTGKFTISFNSQLIPQEQIDNNSDLIIDNYNVAKYLNALNTRIAPLLVCFNQEIRDNLLVDLYVDKVTKVTKLKEKYVLTEKDCTLVSGIPINVEDQDTYQDFITMEDKEIRFWDSVDKLPNHMEEDEWNEIRAEWKERMIREREEGLERERNILLDTFKRLEVSDFIELNDSKKLPKNLSLYFTVEESVHDNFYFVSIKYNEPIEAFEAIYDYEPIAKKRHEFYKTLPLDVKKEDLYDIWLKHVGEVKPDNKHIVQYGLFSGLHYDDEPLVSEEVVEETIIVDNKPDDDWNF